MKRGLLLFFFATIAAMLYYGCEKPKTYPDIPAIQFVSLTSQRGATGLDSNTVITVSFTDGDGDIGYNSSGNGAIFDSSYSIYYDDFVVYFYEKKSGVWVQNTTDTFPNGLPAFSGRLPYLTPTGNNKALSGDISMFQPVWTDPGLVDDTIHYQVYLYDRALHKSNTITTSDLVISTAK